MCSPVESVKNGYGQWSRRLWLGLSDVGLLVVRTPTSTIASASTARTAASPPLCKPEILKLKTQEPTLHICWYDNEYNIFGIPLAFQPSAGPMFRKSSFDCSLFHTTRQQKLYHLITLTQTHYRRCVCSVCVTL